MTPEKTTLLQQLRSALQAGILTRRDVQAVLAESTTTEPSTEPTRLSAVDVMFYIAGIILYASLISVIAQTWQDNSPLLRIFLSVGMASILWAFAYYLTLSPLQSDIRKGLTNSLLLTGSLASITGAYIVINETIDGYGDVNFFAGAAALLITGGLHLLFDRYVTRNILLTIGTFFCVASVPAVLFGILQDTDSPLYVWCGVWVFAAALLAYATRVVSRLYKGARTAPDATDSLAAIIGMGALYVSTYDDLGGLWFVLLIASILGIFYASVRMQNKHLLGSASFFLVISIVTISFRYFSDFGVSISLLLATLGLLGSAAAASTIHKRYFR